MAEPKQYHFKTLDQLAEVVTIDNVDVLATDLRNWLLLCASANELNKTKLVQAQAGGFTWIDDGKNDVNITVKMRGEKGKR